MFGWFERLITEHGSAKVLEQRLAMRDDEIAKLKAEKAALQASHEKAQIEKDYIRDTSEGLRFKMGASTGGQWLLVCPKCGNAIACHNLIRRLMCEDCDWISYVPPERLPSIIASL
jgi:predicted RNA-binding Zn-ribbon protein involved in translation (DUF1610 family)